MVLKSYAKINLSLNINRKLPNGLHDIQSLFCKINLYDKILIKKNNKNIKNDKILFKGPYSKYISRKKNSITQLLKILRGKNLISDYYYIEIYKKIPVFAGFGGGTSNAFTVSKFLLKNRLNIQVRENLIKNIGSDLRLFFYDKGFLKNLGKISSINKKFNLNFLIIYPKIKCSSKKIYSLVTKYNLKKIFSKKNLKNRKNFISYIAQSKNDLQSIVESKYPIIKKLLIEISKEKGCYISRLTGSGSACYGLFDGENSAKVALANLKKKHPNFWFSIAKTI